MLVLESVCTGWYVYVDAGMCVGAGMCVYMLVYVCMCRHVYVGAGRYVYVVVGAGMCIGASLCMHLLVGVYRCW